MGNYRFKLSDMMPNTWFYKLKDMKKPVPTSKKKQSPSSSTATPQKQPKTDQPHNSHPRKSYYFTRDQLVIPSLDNLRASPLSRSHFPSPPRKSSKQRRTKRKSKGSSPRIVTSSVSAGCSCRATATVDSVWSNSKPDSPAAFSSLSASESTDSELSPHSPIQEFRADPNLATQSFDKMLSWSTSCQCKAIDANAGDDKSSVNKNFMSFDGLEYDLVPEVDLPQIVTKPVRFSDMVQSLKPKDDTVKPRSLSVKAVEQESIKVKEERKTCSSSSSSTTTTTTTTNKSSSHSSNSSNRRFSVSSPSTRVKINSPRLGNRRIQGRKSVSSTSSSSTKSSSRRSLSVSDSFAVVKSSFDPQRDFTESMVEMIVQNNIKGSKDLEDLLACYLSLNSDEYHDLIIKVFKQIWFDLCDFQLN